MRGGSLRGRPRQSAGIGRSRPDRTRSQVRGRCCSYQRVSTCIHSDKLPVFVQ